MVRTPLIPLVTPIFAMPSVAMTQQLTDLVESGPLGIPQPEPSFDHPHSWPGALSPKMSRADEFDYNSPDASTKAAGFFQCNPRYQYNRLLGHGAYGLVASCLDGTTGTCVAIKRISQLNSVLVARRTLRELKLLRHFLGHENIVQLLDLYKDETKTGQIMSSPPTQGLPMNPAALEELYISQELMESDLGRLLQQTPTPMAEYNIQQYMYQILCGVKALHSANVLHRDLKPGNILWSHDHRIKLCDFGLARGIEEADRTRDIDLTIYVATRWYRPPEILLYKSAYGKPLDMWAVGCIFAELLNRRVFFPGQSGVEQFQLILQKMGTPSDATLARIPSAKSISYIQRLPRFAKKDLRVRFPDASPDAMDFLVRLLKFDPNERLTVDEALAHPFLVNVRNPGKEVDCPKFDFSFDSKLDNILAIKRAIMEELAIYRQVGVISPPLSLPGGTYAGNRGGAAPATPASITSDTRQGKQGIDEEAQALTSIRPALIKKPSRFTRIEK